MKTSNHNTGEKTGQFNYWYVVSRIVWTLLFLVHLIPVVAVSSRLATAPTFKSAISLLLLLSIMALASLKAVDVKWLRIHLRFKGWCALIMVGLLIHGDFIGSKLPDTIILETSITLMATLALANRQCLKTFQSSLADWLKQLSLAFHHWLEEVVVLQVSSYGFEIASPRGPPSR